MPKIKPGIILLLILSFVLNLALAADLKDEARQAYNKGQEYYQQGKYKEAQAEFNRALSLTEQAKQGKKTGAAAPTAQPVGTASAAQGLKEYIIDKDDVLAISVWQEPGLSQDATIRPDGRISFPLAGDVPALGLTLSQLREELTKRLKEYIKNPVVSVSIKRLGGNKVMLLGEVGGQGVYRVTGKRTILEAIALAGGFTTNAVPSSTLLIRGGMQNPKVTKLDLNQAIMQADMSQNVTLQPEDIVFVPKKVISNFNWFVNNVISPMTTALGLATQTDDAAKRQW
jgi:polysaccharide export outer membrane protein